MQAMTGTAPDKGKKKDAVSEHTDACRAVWMKEGKGKRAPERGTAHTGRHMQAAHTQRASCTIG